MAIRIRFDVDAKPFLAGVEKVKGGLKKTRKSLNTSAKDFAKWGAAGAAAAGAVAVALVKATGDSAKEISNLSKLANVSTGEFQRMAFGASQFGIEQEKLSDILKDVNDKVGDFLNTGGGPMKDFFEKVAPKIGVTAQQFKNLSGSQALGLYVSSLEKANLSQADMVFYMEGIASDSTALLPLLKDNGKAFKELGKEAEALGLVLNGDDIERMKAANIAMGNIGASVTALVQKLTIKFAPLLTKVSKQLAEMIKSGDFEKKIVGAFNGIINSAGFLADALHGVKIAGTTVINGLKLVGYTAQIAIVGVLAAIEGVLISAVSGWQMIINEMITHANKLPMIDIPLMEPIQQAEGAFYKMTAGIAANMKATVAEIQADLMIEMPSTAFKKYTVAAEDAAAKVKEVLTTTDGLVAPVPTKKEEPKTQELGGFSAMAAEMAAKARQADLDAELAYQTTLTGIKRSAQETNDAMMDSSLTWQQSASAKAGRSVLGILAGHSKKAFKINKIAGIGEALISTYQGIAAGLKLGYPMAIPAVAMAAATGFAQVSKLKSMSYGGGGGGGGPSSGGGGPSSGGGSGGSSSTFNMRVQGVGAGEMVSGATMDSIFEGINERIRDGDQLGSVSLA